MKHCYYLFYAVTLLGTAPACKRESANNQEQQLPLVVNKPVPLASEPAPLPKTGNGNFENLVADFERKDRGIWQKPEMVISLLGNLEGKTVADIGAGTGYFTFRLVPRAKKVIGIDIDQRFIQFMDSVKVRMPEVYKNRFETRLAKANDPLLAPEESDAVVVVNTYGYIENRVRYFKTVWKGMKPGAQLLIIDFKKNNLPIGPPEEFRVSLPDVEKELNASGFIITKIDRESLDYQYIVIAFKPTATQQSN
ncbi:MAG: class I SAM-dependent methyltransferase [Bacteroidetes bacterium]|nr:class I SAM-dependent methyltransferase [Bacteroidota bacterium]